MRANLELSTTPIRTPKVETILNLSGLIESAVGNATPLPRLIGSTICRVVREPSKSTVDTWPLTNLDDVVQTLESALLIVINAGISPAASVVGEGGAHSFNHVRRCLPLPLEIDQIVAVIATDPDGSTSTYIDL
jgi:hypothetical protein